MRITGTRPPHYGWRARLNELFVRLGAAPDTDPVNDATMSLLMSPAHCINNA